MRSELLPGNQNCTKIVVGAVRNWPALNGSARTMIKLLVALIGISIFTAPAFGDPSPLGEHRGYTDDVANEPRTDFPSFVAIPYQEEQSETLHERIFDDRLTKEFQIRYEEEFGRTAAEQFYNVPNPCTEFEYTPGTVVTVEEDSRRQREYGNFVIRRLTEYHLDRYFKNSEDLKPVYELKEKASNVQLKTKQGFGVKLRYSLSGSSFRAQILNPYKVDARVVLRDSDRLILSLGYPVSPIYRVDSFYESRDQQVSLIGTKQWAPGLSTNIQLTERPAVLGGSRLITSTTEDSANTTGEREQLFLLGFTLVN